MSTTHEHTSVSKPRTPQIIPLTRLYAAILVILAVCQLFTFTDFQRLIESFWLPGGDVLSHFLSGLIVVSEVFALPFLLRMRLSPIMRYLSMGLGWMVPLFWLFISLWLLFTINAVANVGFLGTAIELTPGWWAVCLSLALAILVTWISWGMWPLLRRSNK